MLQQFPFIVPVPPPLPLRFDSTKKIDASDIFLTLESLSCFVSVRSYGTLKLRAHTAAVDIQQSMHENTVKNITQHKITRRSGQIFL
jgi:hypothetical protein